jgi:AraC-like DNA-binding protein
MHRFNNFAGTTETDRILLPPQLTAHHRAYNPAAMKRKSFNITTYIQKINIWFEPIGPAKLLARTSHARQVPATLQHHVIEGAAISFTQYAFGSILSQKIIVRNKAFWLHVFQINERVTLKPITNALLISLNYLTKGRLDCIVNGRRLLITEGTYQLYALAAAIPYEATLDAGTTIDFHTTVSEEVIPGLIDIYNDDTLNKLYENNFKGMFPEDLFRIPRIAGEHIQKMLNRKHAATTREQFARDAAWDEHLAALFNIYVSNRNQHALQQEWQTTDRLQVRNLPAFIEQHLSDYNLSSSNPLHIKNILKQLRLREPEFHKAVHNEFNMTWRELINHIRMKKASELLLEQPALTIADVASLLGYSYPTHFSRAFKSHYGHTPEQHRKRSF